MKNLVSVGYDFPGQLNLYVPYRSNKSLLDSDIIFFYPEVEGYDIEDYPNQSFQGKTLYSLDGSFNIKEDTARWKHELEIALEAGKTVFLLLGTFNKFYLTDQRSYTGTGRNARPNASVSAYDNYLFFPFNGISLHSSSGKEIKYLGDSLFLTFWNEFKSYLEYHNYIESPVAKKLMATKTGDKTIGGIMKIGKGNLVLLPFINQPEDFTKYDKDKNQSFWTEKAVKFGKRLVQIIIDIDKGLNEEADKTPPPEWLKNDKYVSKKESDLEKSVETINGKIEALTKDKDDVLKEIENEQILKRLLFETGKTLENAIINALEILGYKAENVQDGDLELDQVIISPEGDRFIGEAEGKDSSAINIDKLRQLNTNLQEDLQREEVKEIATGILFGNGFRLTEPEKRAAQFTDKCQSTASKTGILLIDTTTLYEVSEYIRFSNDLDFAKKCRESIKASVGKIVVFSGIPSQ